MFSHLWTINREILYENKFWWHLQTCVESAIFWKKFTIQPLTVPLHRIAWFHYGSHRIIFHMRGSVRDEWIAREKIWFKIKQVTKRLRDPIMKYNLKMFMFYSCPPRTHNITSECGKKIGWTDISFCSSIWICVFFSSHFVQCVQDTQTQHRKFHARQLKIVA